MADLFGLSDRELILFKAQTIAAGHWQILKMTRDNAKAQMVKFCENLNFDELDTKTIVRAIYTTCQNTLLKQKELSEKQISSLPPFQVFGQEVFGDLLKAWIRGGKSEFDETFEMIFDSDPEESSQFYADLSQKIFTFRLTAFEKYGTVENANNLIDQIGFYDCDEISVDEFIEKLHFRMTRGGLTDYEMYGLVLCEAACGAWESMNLGRREVFDLIEEFCRSANLSEGAEQAAQRIFVPTQNALMNFRRDDFYTIQEESPFSDFGRTNLVKFLKAWELGGKESLEQVFNEVFPREWEEDHKPRNEIVRILSGDSETAAAPIRFSTRDRQKRIRAEFCYVYYTFGKNWHHTHSTVIEDDSKFLSRWRLNFDDGSSKTIYFDTDAGEE